MKICVVTGVTREEGLGFAIAAAMVQKGFQVCIGGRDLSKVSILARQIDPTVGHVSAAGLDITNEESVESFMAEIELQYGRIDALINNAATGFDAGLQPLDAIPADVAKTLDTNLLGAWRMARASMPLLRRSTAGRIVNVSSAAGSFSDQTFGIGRHQSIVPMYSISKLALNGFTVQLAAQLRNEGILVNSVDPGFVATYPGLREMGARSPAEAAAGIVWAATLPPDGPTGRFFRDGVEIDW